ncbi:glycosyltransferase family 2 protein [Leptospira sp. 'Mane']|uniref:glycosyltransferase family 2 protein n=1 Tax=Leptospira sp. 'Mane' TaxID=3387407 RepID=UPI00398B8764
MGLKTITYRTIDLTLNKPLITIITVVRNAEKTVDRTIQSVLSQDYSNMEYIIQDGLSTDRTISIIEKSKDRLLFFSEKDSGIYDAMNRAWNKANGDYILFLNADDFFIGADSLEKIVNAVSSGSYDYASANAIVKKKNGESWIWKNRTLTDFDFLCGNPSNHQSFLTSKSSLKSIGGFDIKYKYAADVKFMFELINRGFSGIKIDDCIVEYSFEGESSVNEKKGILELEEIMNIYSPELSLAEVGKLRRMLGDGSEKFDISFIESVLVKKKFSDNQYRYFINELVRKINDLEELGSLSSRIQIHRYKQMKRILDKLGIGYLISFILGFVRRLKS